MNHMKRVVFLVFCICQSMVASCCLNPCSNERETQEYWVQNGVRLYTWREDGQWNFYITSASISHLLTFDQIRKNADRGLSALEKAVAFFGSGTKIYWYELDSYSERLELPHESFLNRIKNLCTKKDLGLTLLTDDRGDVVLAVSSKRDKAEDGPVLDPDPSKN